jgi:Flp pilus assembly pilin Flp
MTDLAARIQTTLYVFSERLRSDERGQTTAEYVGIVAFVALLAVAIMGMSGEFGTAVKGIIDAAFSKIQTKLGS